MSGRNNINNFKQLRQLIKNLYLKLIKEKADRFLNDPATGSIDADQLGEDEKGAMMISLKNIRKAVFTGIFLLPAFGFLFAQQQNIVLPSSNITEEEKDLMRKAVPDRPIVPPKKTRTLLVYDVNGKYIGHNAIPYANFAFRLMGRKTGAFELVLARDPDCFEWENLKQYDAIFFNNVVGAPFCDKKLYDNIIRFVKEGGGLMGVHGTTAAFLLAGENWKDVFPEFGNMIGARGANHRSKSETAYIKVEDPDHPITRMLPPQGFEKVDEFFRFSTVYSRNNLRVLLSLDNEKSGLDKDPPKRRERADQDYGVAWIRAYGKGRVFYCSLAHHFTTFYDPVLMKFYLAGIQYVLGDLKAPDSPSGNK